ncbi:class E sortase [Frigoribacterium sp. CG_9.8]|uniref:class E sortase n=1 Tax=Frigoribacterium sp. CG_9.8 TaxID=2787733 RepID=UPI0018C92962|nr:class E sortase [Frigoribacterium sp. CG_9.8]MBG6108694.1 sortase A [Frigoribacterium sp. CG_9.8]
MDEDGGEGAVPAKPRPRASVVGVLGEVLVTCGVLVFLFLGWQVWLNDLIVGADQNRAGTALGEGWDKTPPSRQHATAPATTPSATPSVSPSPGLATDFGEPVVGSAPRDTVKFAVLYVPRFGADYARSISEGVETAEVLDRNGIGHYPDTQMPGQVGNFAIAAHRTTHGAPFKPLANLQVGDKIYVRTPDGYYTYSFRGLEYVRPTGVGVLSPVPQFAGAETTDRILTMTSCNPEFSAAERIIAYAALESWQPTSAGAPAAISAAVTAKS